MKTRPAPASPILNPEEFLQGETAIMPTMIALVPKKLSMMENFNGYVVEDDQGRIFILSVGEINKLDWHNLGLPESGAYKSHLEEWIKINGVQND